MAMQKWDVQIDYQGGDVERIYEVMANTAEMAMHVALLVRRSPKPPVLTRIVAIGNSRNEPVGAA